MKMVLDYLRYQLKTVCVTTEGIGYKLRVLCSECEPTEQPHLHGLEDCLKKKVRCGKMAMNTSRLKRLFSAESPASPENIQPMQSMQLRKSNLDRLVSELELNTFSGNIGADWKSFVRSLGLKNREIFYATADERTERDRIFSCLLKWRDKEAHNATVKALVDKCINHQIDLDVYAFLAE
ncbi:uncharacterized protein LOC117106723 [Anneissia japonica]|uniref:uncharacterized protein LOC117106723 n=1 Tax=Anneissia japonica TaxID=1529436 RepID=UPI00142588C9|nr:uncharacterized protein LOC117106723 [Anneissia japonica]